MSKSPFFSSMVTDSLVHFIKNLVALGQFGVRSLLGVQHNPSKPDKSGTYLTSFMMAVVRE